MGVLKIMIANHIKTFFVLLFAIVFLSACASKETSDPDPIESTEQAYYEKAKNSIKIRKYLDAIEYLEQLELRYPFGRYAEQAQLDLIYAYYKSVNYEGTRATADRFIRLHSKHPQLDYAYYYRGLASFSQDLSLLDKFLPGDRSKRDPGSAKEAIADFSILLSRFPNSKYAGDAQARMVYLRNLLAAHEIHVAHYYLKREAYIAAANRGRYVVENLQKTPSVPDGLAVMIEAYSQLGMDDLADKSLQVLSMNYPNYSALGKDGTFNFKRSKAGPKRSILNRATFGLLDKTAEK